MKQAEAPTIVAPEKQSHWHRLHPGIWRQDGVDVESVPARSILTTLWDQPRWLEAYHLYDARGSELFEEICRLPEYYLTRTEDAILERCAAQVIDAAPVKCIVELGAGYSKKTVHLLTEQLRRRGPSTFAPIDVSLAGLLASRDAVQRDFPDLEFHGLHARYEDGFRAIDKNLPTLYVFLGSSIGNFNLTEFPRFLRALSRAMGPGDFLLLGADRIKPVQVLEKAYNDSRGLTADFILNVFHNINRLLQSNFDLRHMRYYSWFNPEWRQVEMYAVATERQDIVFRVADTGFCWDKDEKILVEISRKFDPLRLQEQLRFFDLQPLAHFTDPQEWFSLLLFKKDPSVR
jgi:dimethylhistidine N-methyltransferase